MTPRSDKGRIKMAYETPRIEDRGSDSWSNEACCTNPGRGTLAGASPGSNDGIGSAARFWLLSGVTVDKAGNIYVSDTSSIRKITPTGAVTTLVGVSADGTNSTGSVAQFREPSGLSVDGAGNLYFAENHTIRKMSPDGAVTTLAGVAGQSGSADGDGNAARFYYPSALAADEIGNVYVADTLNNMIRKVELAGSHWVVTTVAGLAMNSGSNDGIGSAARFSQPRGIAVDKAGNLYVSDSGNSLIRKVTARNQLGGDDGGRTGGPRRDRRRRRHRRQVLDPWRTGGGYGQQSLCRGLGKPHRPETHVKWDRLAGDNPRWEDRVLRSER